MLNDRVGSDNRRRQVLLKHASHAYGLLLWEVAMPSCCAHEVHLNSSLLSLKRMPLLMLRYECRTLL